MPLPPRARQVRQRVREPQAPPLRVALFVCLRIVLQTVISVLYAHAPRYAFVIRGMYTVLNISILDESWAGQTFRKEVMPMQSLPREQAQGIVEYALILVLVTLVVLVILTLLGPAIGNAFSNIVHNI